MDIYVGGESSTEGGKQSLEPISDKPVGLPASASALHEPSLDLTLGVGSGNISDKTEPVKDDGGADAEDSDGSDGFGPLF